MYQEPVGLAITHIFPCSINGLLASLKGVSFCAEPFEGAPFRVILSGSNIDRGRNYNCPCGWSKMWVIARAAGPVLVHRGALREGYVPTIHVASRAPPWAFEAGLYRNPSL